MSTGQPASYACPLLQKAGRTKWLTDHQKHCYCQWSKFWEISIGLDNQKFIDARAILVAGLLQKQDCGSLTGVKERRQWWMLMSCLWDHGLQTASHREIHQWAPSQSCPAFSSVFMMVKIWFKVIPIFSPEITTIILNKRFSVLACCFHLHHYSRGRKSVWVSVHAPMSRVGPALQIPCLNGSKFTYRSYKVLFSMLILQRRDHTTAGYPTGDFLLSGDK